MGVLQLRFFLILKTTEEWGGGVMPQVPVLDTSFFNCMQNDSFKEM